MRYSGIIKQIEWIDKEILEAETLIEVNGQKFWAFCHPLKSNIGEIVDVDFDFIEEELPIEIFWSGNSDAKKEIIPCSTNRLKYYCFGQILKINDVIVDCGVLQFSMGNLTNDENVVGSYVYFVISRLDLVL